MKKLFILWVTITLWMRNIQHYMQQLQIKSTSDGDSRCWWNPQFNLIRKYAANDSVSTKTINWLRICKAFKAQRCFWELRNLKLSKQHPFKQAMLLIRRLYLKFYYSKSPSIRLAFSEILAEDVIDQYFVDPIFFFLYSNGELNNWNIVSFFTVTWTKSIFKCGVSLLFLNLDT